MMESYPACSDCNGDIVKNGKSKNGMQRYYCRKCAKSFQIRYFYQACGSNTNDKIISLTKEGCGIRSIARLLKISITTVIRRIKSIAKSLSRPFAIIKGKEYEVDEMRTYIANKKRLYWIVYALRKDTREVIDFRVGKRTSKTLQPVLDTVLLSDASQVCTDGYSLYGNRIPPKLHCKSKYKINHIERKNLSIRTHLKRLSRRTICFSKSREMLEACLRIYFWSGRTFLSKN